jgi:hypothetical protein
VKRLGIDSVNGCFGAVLLVAMLTAMSAWAAPTPATTVGNMPARPFDAFLSGLDTQCATTPQFEAFRQALRLHDGDTYRLTPAAAKAVVDAPIRSAIGDIRILEETGEYQLIEVDVTGTWREVPVEAIQFWLGKSNGITGTAVIFSPPSEPALKIFQTRIEQSATRMAKDPDNDVEASTGLKVEDGRAHLWCDWST